MRSEFNRQPNRQNPNNYKMVKQAITTAAIIGSLAYMTKVGVVDKIADKFEKSVSHKAAQTAKKNFTPSFKKIGKFFTEKFDLLKTNVASNFQIVKDTVLKFNPIEKLTKGITNLISKVVRK